MTISPVTFTIFSDIHQDIMHDAPQRLQIIVDAAKSNRSDFLIQLGDFCHPIDENLDFINIYHQHPGRSYHVLGNHDMDHHDKTLAMRFFGLENSYYFFDIHHYRFVVLDTNFLRIHHQDIDYANGNFFNYPQERTYLSESQLNWFQKTIESANGHVVLFSHANLYESRYGIRNHQQLHSIIQQEHMRCGYQKIIAAFNGHTHIDQTHTIQDIHYIDINSASNQWLGEDFALHRYPVSVYQQRPSLQYVLPYADPVFAHVTISPEGVIDIDGRSSRFVGPDPQTIGYDEDAAGYIITPCIQSKQLFYSPQASSGQNIPSIEP